MGNFAENLNLGKRVLPPCLSRDNFCWPTWKREVRKNGNIKQGKVENWMKNGRGGKVTKRGEELFFLFLFLFFLAFPLFKITEFCSGSTGNKYFTPGKNQKKWLCPLRKIFLLRLWSEARAPEQSRSCFGLAHSYWHIHIQILWELILKLKNLSPTPGK